jgi:general secretion pathway protein D
MTIPAFAAFLNFLQTNSEANIVSTPNILTLDNQKASIDVSKTIYAKKVTQSGTTGFQAVEPTPLEAGLTLEITPQITEGDAVRLEIRNKLSNFTGEPDPDTGAAPQTKREIQTTVVAMNGQTVVLGGLMQDIDTLSKSKVPIIGDIPVLGWLFQYRSKTANKSNLLIFITPNVIHDPTDFAEITKRKIDQRNAFIEGNYGKSRQKSLRQTIAAHRADLLEFTQPTASSAQPSEMLQSSARPLPMPPAQTSVPSQYAPTAAPAPAPAVKHAVPVQNPGKPDIEVDGGVDVAY